MNPKLVFFIALSMMIAAGATGLAFAAGLGLLVCLAIYSLSGSVALLLFTVLPALLDDHVVAKAPAGGARAVNDACTMAPDGPHHAQATLS